MAGDGRHEQDQIDTTKNLIQDSRRLRDRFMADPHRPRYHFVTPEGLCMPFDPNGAIFWKGRYHLFYIFQNELGHCWGHASSIDLLHWAHHPTALVPGNGDQGIFSGNAFLNKEGVPTIAYAGINTGVCIATADDDDLIGWTKSPANPVIPAPKQGDAGWVQYQVGDPHMWLEGQTYYCLTGAWSIAEGTGDTLYLFESQDMVHWKYLHRFYDRNPEWTGPKEDCSCADFYKLGDRWMLLCISHYVGCRYYLGRYEDHRFIPQEHHRMNWPGGPCFAPESLLDEHGRRIFWAWCCESRSGEAQQAAGWSGVMSLPRVLSLADDGTLRIEPADELKKLRLRRRKRKNIALAGDEEVVLRRLAGDCMELALEADVAGAQQFGLAVRRCPDGAEQTLIIYDSAARTLSIDAGRSSLSGDVYQPDHHPFSSGWAPGKPDYRDVRVQAAPFELRPGEWLKLRVFLDRSILEVFANDRQCLTQRIYPSRGDSLGVAVFCRGGCAQVSSLEAWQMAAANAW
ncbi:MAG TPA: glycoside hydrolase family 32 protein [Phycisphaerae bacterium]|nr:glycoside hydrolase family 32 protein [Phycisphaerae bacterium]